jgi:hypothetical protein
MPPIWWPKSKKTVSVKGTLFILHAARFCA